MILKICPHCSRLVVQAKFSINIFWCAMSPTFTWDMTQKSNLVLPMTLFYKTEFIVMLGAGYTRFDLWGPFRLGECNVLSALELFSGLIHICTLCVSYKMQLVKVCFFVVSTLWYHCACFMSSTLIAHNFRSLFSLFLKFFPVIILW